jgi:flagellar biosynthesis GTPase FlhF
VSEDKKARTQLGKYLLILRKKAIDEGMELLSDDEVLEEVSRRRSGSEEAMSTTLKQEQITCTAVRWDGEHIDELRRILGDAYRVVESDVEGAVFIYDRGANQLFVEEGDWIAFFENQPMYAFRRVAVQPNGNGKEVKQ